jgi:hypothetical protein
MNSWPRYCVTCAPERAALWKSWVWTRPGTNCSTGGRMSRAREQNRDKRSRSAPMTDPAVVIADRFLPEGSRRRSRAPPGSGWTSATFPPGTTTASLCGSTVRAPPQMQALSSYPGSSRGGGGLIMQYSWPGPIPPGARRGTIRLIRCARCGEPLYHTKARGQPRQEDHEQGCEAFITAMRVMRYVDELKQSASESSAAWGSRRRKYLRENAKALSAAACASDPVAALKALGDLREAECQTPGRRVRAREKTQMAETLMRACRQLAQGEDPGPIPRPG